MTVKDFFYTDLIDKSNGSVKPGVVCLWETDRVYGFDRWREGIGRLVKVRISKRIHQADTRVIDGNSLVDVEYNEDVVPEIEYEKESEVEESTLADEQTPEVKKQGDLYLKDAAKDKERKEIKLIKPKVIDESKLKKPTVSSKATKPGVKKDEPAGVTTGSYKENR